MNKQIAFAYGIAGLAVAAALITVVTTSTPEPQVVAPTVNQEQATPAASQEIAQAVPEAPIEYVYQDEPVVRRHHEDDDDHGKQESRERHHREDGDEDDD